MKKTRFADRFLRTRPATPSLSLWKRINLACGEWIVRHFILVCSALALVCLSPSFMYAQSSLGFAWRDFAMLWGPTSARFELCWERQAGQPAFDPAAWVELRRTRMEGGPTTTPVLIPRVLWVPKAGTSQFCAPNQQLARAGHWVFEVRSCKPTQPQPTCTAWLSSMNPQYAAVNGQFRAWQIYGYVAAPGPPTSTDIPNFFWMNPNTEIRAHEQTSETGDRLLAERQP